MANLINADPTAGLKLVSSSSSDIQIQSNGVTVCTINANGLSMNTGTLATNAPAFSAYISTANQSVSSATWTKVTLNAEHFDTTSDYDNSTNYRYTPSVAGYYQVNFALRADATSKTRVHCALYKNGSVWHYGTGNRDSTSSPTYVSGSSLIYLNGSTDYIEMYGYVNGTSTSFSGTDQRFSTFEAHLARAA